MEKQNANNEELYEKTLKKKIKWTKVLSSLCNISCIVIIGGLVTSFMVTPALGYFEAWIITVFGGILVASPAILGLRTIAKKMQKSSKEYEETLQELEAHKLSFEKEKTMDKGLSKEMVKEETKSEFKTLKVEENLDHNYVYDEMEDIPVLKFSPVNIEEKPKVKKLVPTQRKDN